MTENKWASPQPISDMELAFPANALARMPSRQEIPAEFWLGHTKWNELASHWFFRGLKNAQFRMADGIDQDMALRHLGAILGSYQPKHEHKEAAVAYLMSLWFSDVKHGGRET